MSTLTRLNLALARLAAIACTAPCVAAPTAASASSPALPGHAGAPFAQMPDIAPIGMHIDKYIDVPEGAKGPPIDAAKGYRLEQLGRGLYMVTDNAYQSMFLVHETGVVMVDAPPSYASKLKRAIADVTALPITHLVYSHAHADHIGGAGSLGGHPVIVAQEETLRLLKRAADPARPLPTVTFKDRYVLRAGSQRLELSYHGNGHEPGNIFIWAPEHKTLMVVDIVFPGWMPFRRLAVSQDIPGWIEQVGYVNTLPFEKLVSGHVTRLGTHAGRADADRLPRRPQGRRWHGARVDIVRGGHPSRRQRQCMGADGRLHGAGGGAMRQRADAEVVAPVRRVRRVRVGPVLHHGAEPAGGLSATPPHAAIDRPANLAWYCPGDTPTSRLNKRRNELASA